MTRLTIIRSPVDPIAANDKKWLLLNFTLQNRLLFKVIGAPLIFIFAASPLCTLAQTTGSNDSTIANSASAASLVRWTGSLPEAAGRTTEINFELYEEPTGGSAVWSETQTVKVGADGRYTVLLGANSSEGLPQAIFQAGEARWVEARPLDAQQIAVTVDNSIAGSGNALPLTRSLLAAVPYSFESQNAERLAGRAADEYVTRDNLTSSINGQLKAMTNSTASIILPSTPTGTGTSGYLPIWTTPAALGNSIIAESGNNVGIGTNSPATILDVNGVSTLRGMVSLLASAATLAGGSNSPALQLGASTYSSFSNAPITQNFAWQAISSGNNTAKPGASLKLLFGSGTSTPTATGLSIDSTGVITFAPEQTFPKTVGASSTLTGVTAGAGLSGGGSSGNVTLALAGPISMANGGTGAATSASALANLGGISSTLSAPQTLAGPLTGTALNAKFFNGIPQADQFEGADFCVKLRAANLWALANGYTLVDATHFPSTVTCSVDPIGSLKSAGATTSLTVELPAAWISSSVPWIINNSSLKLEGKGPGQSVLAYTGSKTVSGVLTLGGSATNAYYSNTNVVSGISVIGEGGNAIDGVLAIAAGGWKLEDVSTWGVTGCGIHTKNAVTVTLIRPHTWSDEASRIGYLGSKYSQPTSGLCFDQSTAGATTTDGTVVDPIATGVSGAGFNYIAVQGMTMTSGTSEGNGSGILLQTNAVLNTFINTDLEANTSGVAGVDIKDSGWENRYINVLALSSCSSCNSVVLNNGSYFDGGRSATGVGGNNPFSSQGSNFYNQLFAENDSTTSSDPLVIFTPNLTSGFAGICIGPNRYCGGKDGSINLYPGSRITLGMSTGPQMSIDSSGNVIAPASITSPTLASSALTGTPPLVVTSKTPVANLTLASAVQVPALPESQIVNLVADLATRASTVSPVFTGTITHTFNDVSSGSNKILETIRKFGGSTGSASNGSAIWILSDPAGPSNENGTEIESNSSSSGPYRFGSNGDSNIINKSNASLNLVVGATPVVAVKVASSGVATFNNGIVSTSYSTGSYCSSKTSPAACGSASAGKVLILASTKNLEIDSTNFTANTGCWFTYDTSGMALPTNISSLLTPYISARIAGKGITISIPVPPLVNPINLLFGCEN